LVIDLHENAHICDGKGEGGGGSVSLVKKKEASCVLRGGAFGTGGERVLRRTALFN